MYNKYIKRIFDFTAAVVLLTLASPLFVVIAVMIKLTSRGPAVFTQQRSGVDGRKFNMLKFRTMEKNNDVHDATSEDRITGIGRFLRASSLDELPQLINVVRGEMSFIGPRPWITAYYEHMDAPQRRRYSVRPGITGIAQVYGRNNLTIHEKIAYDLRYVTHVGIYEDLKVIFLTFMAIVSKEGQEMGKSAIHKELDTLRECLENSELLYREPNGSKIEQ